MTINIEYKTTEQDQEELITPQEQAYAQAMHIGRTILADLLEQHYELSINEVIWGYSEETGNPALMVDYGGIEENEKFIYMQFLKDYAQAIEQENEAELTPDIRLFNYDDLEDMSEVLNMLLVITDARLPVKQNNPIKWSIGDDISSLTMLSLKNQEFTSVQEFQNAVCENDMTGEIDSAFKYDVEQLNKAIHYYNIVSSGNTQNYTTDSVFHLH